MAPPLPAPLPDPAHAALQKVLDAWLTSSGVIGATAAVMSPEGTWSGAAGADGAGTKLVPEAAMALASITKTFTAAEVMTLAAEDRVDLDTPIDRYVRLPFVTNGATVRQVLNMRSGFPAEPRIYMSGLDRSWSGDEVLSLAADDTTRSGQLGGEQVYNNINYVALGEMVETVTGGHLSDELRRDLVDPAGLDRMWLQDAEEPEPPLMVAQESVRVATVDEDGPWLPSRSTATIAGAAGAMAGDAADTARWGYLLYGGFLIEPGLVGQMTELAQPGDFYGLGTNLFDAGSVGHLGMFASSVSSLRVWPQDDLAVAVLVPAPSESATPDVRTAVGELSGALRSAALLERQPDPVASTGAPTEDSLAGPLEGRQGHWPYRR